MKLAALSFALSEMHVESCPDEDVLYGFSYILDDIRKELEATGEKGGA